MQATNTIVNNYIYPFYKACTKTKLRKVHVLHLRLIILTHIIRECRLAASQLYYGLFEQHYDRIKIEI